ncbi:MAG TPA: carboxypeptidase-like regulatory domain-containing protein [Planctomycetota bacterium]|nr:carboxypeptidase-like regulatory domain-containing protein [Planctomycetota bacterium]
MLDVATRACFADPRLQIAVYFMVGERFSGAGADAPDPATLTSTTSVPFAARLCRVVVECPGYMPGAFDLEVQRRAEPYELTIPLERAVRAIRGVVVDGAGRPVQDATAQLFDEVGDGWRRAEVGPATTSKDGRIGFTGIGASRKRIAITATGFAAACVDLPEGAADLEPTVVLSPGATVRFTGPPDDVHSPANGALRVVAADGRVVVHDTINDRRDYNGPCSWPRPLTLAAGAYDWSIEFDDGTGDAGAFVAAEGTDIVVTPRAR